MPSIEERVDRLESIEAIRDLAARYAVTLDERDMDGLVGLFVEDVKASRDAVPGRDALRASRYLDRYERRDGRWYFRWRRTAQWYVKQDPDAPQDQPRIHWPDQEPSDAPLPDMIETFRRYYETRGGRG